VIGHERKGRLKSWNDEKGFGFIAADSGGADVFAHISAMRGERRPVPGDQVLYVEGRDEKGRLRAEHLRLAGEMSLDRPAIRRKPKPVAAPQPRKAPSNAPRTSAGNTEPSGPIRNFGGKILLLIALCLLPLLGAQKLLVAGVVWVLPLYMFASVASFLQYWLDKRSAQDGSRRISENTLHLVELAGGWPGALIAQQTFRHKTRKASYQALFWLIVAAHQLFWIDLVLLDGAYIARHMPLFVQ